MGVIKSEAAPEVVAAIDNIESRADECYKALGLLQLPANLATWALLTGAVRMVEQEIKQSSDDSPQLSATLRNLSLFVPIAINWALKHGQPVSQDADLRWTPSSMRRPRRRFRWHHSTVISLSDFPCGIVIDTPLNSFHLMLSGLPHPDRRGIGR